MDNATPTTRPAILETLSTHQLNELEFQADEYDFEEFDRIAATYGWDQATIDQVRAWFEVRNNYPFDELEG